MKGRFGIHGGQYIPETLMNAVIKLEEAYQYYKNDESFCCKLDKLLKNYAGSHHFSTMQEDDEGPGWCKNLFEKRGFKPYGIT